MQLIHKKCFDLNKTQQLFELPQGADIVKFDVQKGLVCFWYLFDRKQTTNTQARRFAFFGTGDMVADSWEYVMSTEMTHPYVWHLFEEI